MKKRKKLILIFALSLSLTGIIFHFAVMENENALFLIAEGLDKPSKRYYIVTERIYNLSERKKVRDKIREHLERNNNDHLHNLYIQVLGITGDSSSSGILIKLYSLYQQDMNRRSTVSRIIDAMGQIGDEDFVPFLETLVRDYDKLRVQATKYSILRSLYLITGNRYSYFNSSGRKSELEVTEELIDARRVIMNSKGRKRSIQEMLVLEKLYRPPGW
jgi:hypothetical protein